MNKTIANKPEKKAFVSWFRHSQRAGLADRCFSFLFTLSCGYSASCMLDMAMAQERGELIRTGLVFLVLLAVGLPVVWILSRSAEKARILDRQQFREELYHRILTNRLEVSSVGEQELLLGDISNQVAEQYQVRIPKIIEGLCIIAGTAVLMCLERISIGILFTAMGLIQILPVFTYEKWTKKIYEESWDSDEAETDWITQGVDGIRTLKAYGAESWFIKCYQAVNRRGIAAGSKAETAGGLENVLYSSINAILRYGSYVILGLYVLYGNLPVSSLPILVILSGYSFSSMENLFTFFRYRATYHLAVQKLREAQRQKPVVGDPGVLRVEGVSKAFDDKRVLKDVSICIKRGERVNLSGANGSGKSTLISILLGELTPDTGMVWSGVRLAVALQEDPALPLSASAFIATLEKQADWSMEQFHRHLQGFHFSTELLMRPTQELSGGERKKLFLSVALARNAELLILDEPTNHLDAESRAYLKEVLLSCSCAMLVCTHDPDFCLPWDKSLHLEGGVSNG